MHDSARERSWRVEVQIDRGSIAFEVFELFLNIREHRAPKGWEKNTLFGFNSTKDLYKQFSLIQQNAGLPRNYFTCGSFQNGAVVHAICEMILQGKSTAEAKKKVDLRRGYDWSPVRMQKVLGWLPDTMEYFRAEEKVSTFSKIPLEGLYEDDLFSNSQLSCHGQLYLDLILPSTEDLQSIHIHLESLHACLQQSVRGRFKKNHKNILKAVSRILFSLELPYSKTIHQIAKEASKKGIEKTISRQIVVFAFVSCGILRSDNWEKIVIPSFVAKALLTMTKESPPAPRPSIPYSYNISTTILNHNPAMGKALVERLARRRKLKHGRHPMVPMVNRKYPIDQYLAGQET